MFKGLPVGLSTHPGKNCGKVAFSLRPPEELRKRRLFLSFARSVCEQFNQHLPTPKIGLASAKRVFSPRPPPKKKKNRRLADLLERLCLWLREGLPRPEAKGKLNLGALTRSSSREVRISWYQLFSVVYDRGTRRTYTPKNSTSPHFFPQGVSLF